MRFLLKPNVVIGRRSPLGSPEIFSDMSQEIEATNIIYSVHKQKPKHPQFPVLLDMDLFVVYRYLITFIANKYEREDSNGPGVDKYTQ
jgi:hypothetical protein